jgi:hypothetical protein
MGLLFGDNIEINHTTAAPAYPQTIHEHRAPTDKSVELLREMEDASKESIIGSCLIEDNTLNGLVVIFQRQAMVMSRVAYIRFTFNGKEYVIKEELHHSFEWKRDEERAEVVRMLFDAVMKKVGDEIWPATIKALMSNVREAP